MSEPKDTYDLVISHLHNGGADGATELSAAGLKAIAERMAAVEGDARLDRVLGVVAALEYVSTLKNAAGAGASLLALILGVVERTALTDAERAAWEKRMQQTLGAGSDAAQKVLSSGPRPAGTIPAGPGARFAAQKKP
jgi:hypothetical protein